MGIEEVSAELQARQVQRMAEKRLADLMANAGVSSSQMAQELLWFLPRDFVYAYSEVFYAAFAGKDDGGVNGRGQMEAEKARLGKASGKGLQGLGGAKRKTFKKYWVIADENAVDIKDRADKRLRAMAREMKLGLEESSAGEEGKAGGSGRPRCNGCGRMAGRDWAFCAGCGEDLKNRK